MFVDSWTTLLYDMIIICCEFCHQLLVLRSSCFRYFLVFVFKYFGDVALRVADEEAGSDGAGCKRCDWRVAGCERCG